MRAVIIANRNDLFVTCWYPRNVMDLYVGVRHFFAFPCLVYYKRRRHDTMSWNTYFNVLLKRKVKVFGEQLWLCLVVKRHVQLGKNIYQNNAKL